MLKLLTQVDLEVWQRLVDEVRSIDSICDRNDAAWQELVAAYPPRAQTPPTPSAVVDKGASPLLGHEDPEELQVEGRNARGSDLEPSPRPHNLPLTPPPVVEDREAPSSPLPVSIHDDEDGLQVEGQNARGSGREPSPHALSHPPIPSSPVADEEEEDDDQEDEDEDDEEGVAGERAEDHGSRSTSLIPPPSTAGDDGKGLGDKGCDDLEEPSDTSESEHHVEELLNAHSDGYSPRRPSSPHRPSPTPSGPSSSKLRDPPPPYQDVGLSEANFASKSLYSFTPSFADCPSVWQTIERNGPGGRYQRRQEDET